MTLDKIVKGYRNCSLGLEDMYTSAKSVCNTVWDTVDDYRHNLTKSDLKKFGRISLSFLYLTAAAQLVCVNQAEAGPKLAYSRQNSTREASPRSEHRLGLPSDRNIMTSKYGWRQNPFNKKQRDYHKGIDMLGKYVLAAHDGSISRIKKDKLNGNLIEIKNKETGLVTRYSHGKDDTIKHSVGDLVYMGDIIMEVGKSGKTTGPHVHFSVLIEGTYYNPCDFFTAKVEYQDNEIGLRGGSSTPVYHRIERGETLRGISGIFGTPVPQLQEWNGIENPNKIYAKQRLRVK